LRPIAPRLIPGYDARCAESILRQNVEAYAHEMNRQPRDIRDRSVKFFSVNAPESEGPAGGGG
jgi:hypothetical protein